MSKLERWNPFKFKRSKSAADGKEVAVTRQSEASQIQNPLDQLFKPLHLQRFWHDPFAMFDEMDRFFGDFSPRSFQPIVDVVDEGTALRVSAELPGLDASDIDA